MPCGVCLHWTAETDDDYSGDSAPLLVGFERASVVDVVAGSVASSLTTLSQIGSPTWKLS